MARPKRQVPLRFIGAGDIVRARRQHVGHSQQWLADRLGMTRAQVANIERGATQLPVRRLADLVDALSLSPDQLMTLVRAFQADYWNRRT